MAHSRSALAAAAAAALVATTLSLAGSPTATAQAAARTVKVTNGCLKSVPEPGSKEKVEICYTIFKPAVASKRHKVPFLMHSHGWGGSRTTDPASFKKFLDAGYGVLSFDQRGFGASGGMAHVENPRFEGRDNLKLIKLVAGLPWVKKDGPGDPRLGAIGGSYGGGYQLLGAFMELNKKGKPVYDALAPEITWYDLRQSLAPRKVVRTTWAAALATAGADALPPKVLSAFSQSAATGQYPSELNPFFRRNGSKWHVDHGKRLNIPVLFGQGTTDTLFELRQGFLNFQEALTAKARKKSIFVGYNGGHVLPKTVPPGTDVTSDPCSKQLGGGSFSDLSLKFFDTVLKHRDRGLTGFGKYHLATPASTCTTVSSVKANQTFDVGTVATTASGGVPIAYPVAEGPIRVAGSPYLTGDLTVAGASGRAFYGLAIGTSPLDAKLVQKNTLPLNIPGPVTGQPVTVKLPAVAVDVPEGQNLYVFASPVDDIFGMSRVPGVVLLDNTVAHLPVVAP